MKNITTKEFYDAPAEVQHLYVLGWSKIPVSQKAYDTVIEKYPEYFPEEIKQIGKWDSIPQEVHDAYWEEYWKLEEEIMKDVPKRGISEMINDSELLTKWIACSQKGEPLRKKLHKKHYSKYGV